MKIILGILILNVMLVLAVGAHAQSVSPIIAECGHHCSGQFVVWNDQLDVLNVTVEPFSFGLSPKSETTFRPLDTNADVTLHEGAARIGPKSQHMFDYDIRCAQAPCPVAFVVAMTVGKPNPDGLTLRMIVPALVYQCDKARGCRKTVRAAAGLGE